MKRNYLVVYEKGRKNLSGFAPDVPGCASAGKTLEEIRANMAEALGLYLETSAAFGDELPEAKTLSVTLPIKGELDPKTTYIVEFLPILLPKKVRTVRRKTAARDLVAA